MKKIYVKYGTPIAVRQLGLPKVVIVNRIRKEKAS